MNLYRFGLLVLFMPVFLAGALWRIARGRESFADLFERLGRGARPPVARGQVIWLHGASVGELASARPLAELLLARDPRLTLIVTANTVTGRDQARSWGLARVSARLAPLDLRPVLKRFFADWQPAALVQLEKELWPNRMQLARQRSVPVLQAAALMSARSARKWARVPGLARTVLGLADLVAPQDGETEERMLALGLPPRRLARRLNLKAAVSMTPPDPGELARMALLLPKDKTFLAASTHAGEEEIVLAALRKAREFDPALKLIIAPRHPARADAVAGVITRAGQAMARRSKGELPGPETAVYLADTLGEMGLWYRIAPAAFVGGSLVPVGGHTPYEPVQLGCAVVHGPHTGNNAAAYALLAKNQGAALVHDAGSLSAEMLRLTGNPQGRQAMTARARRLLDGGEASGGKAGGGIEAFARDLATLTANPALAQATD